MVMSSSSGVCDGSVVMRSTRYCTYCERSINGPGAGRSVKLLQVASGVGVSPVLTYTARLVPGGVEPFQERLAQSTGLFASNTRDANDPAGAYGVMRIQSTNTTPPNGLKS